MGKKRKKQKQKERELSHVSDVMRRQAIDVMSQIKDDELIMGSVALVLAIKLDPVEENNTAGGHASRCGVDITLHSNMAEAESGPQVAYQILTMMRDQAGLIYKALDESRERAKAEMARRGQDVIHYASVDGSESDLKGEIREGLAKLGQKKDGAS